MILSSSIKELATALVKVQAEMPAVDKDGENPHFKSKFSTLATVMQTALPVLTKHGLAVSQFAGTDDRGQNTLTTVLMHTSGEYITSSMPLIMVKNDPQAQGSAITYARRYSFMSAIGIVADEDDDAEKAMLGKVYTPGPRVATPTIHGEVCKKCGSTALYEKVSNSEKNPGRAFYSCDACKGFSHWVPNTAQEFPIDNSQQIEIDPNNPPF